MMNEFETAKQEALDDLEAMERRITKTRVMILEANNFPSLLFAMLNSPMAKHGLGKANKNGEDDE